MDRYTAFLGQRRLASGPLHDVVLAAQAATESGAVDPIVIFDDTTGRAVDVDLQGRPNRVSTSAVGAAVPPTPPTTVQRTEAIPVPGASGAPRGRGRPKLGVVARQVTLLPWQWDWLHAQPGGASVVLRQLVEASSLANRPAYHFIVAMAAHLQGFADATRALAADDSARFREAVAGWPDDVRSHAIALAFPEASSGLSG